MQETYIPVLGEGIVFDLSCAGTKRSFAELLYTHVVVLFLYSGVISDKL